MADAKDGGMAFRMEIDNKDKGSNPDNYYDMSEKFVRNLQINFGPQHPAAHGVLRWIGRIFNNTDSD